MARGRKRKEKKKAEVIPALSLACVTYLHRCVLWEPPTERIRRPQRARESRSECERGSGGVAGGAAEQRVIFVPSQAPGNRSQQEDRAI